MASVFTYDPDPPRVSSPWSTSGSTTPTLRRTASGDLSGGSQDGNAPDPSDPGHLAYHGITKLDVEPQDGPTEYKLHLLLRPRRSFTSLSTGNLISGSNHSKLGHDVSQLPPEQCELASKVPLASSNQTRQHRLHQLTTQLLWRLQQSSPFHSSSSTAELVLPVLPEATPTLNIPKTLSPLVPGLEESQGALYEIGVSDDGTFVGLAEDELEESRVNLEAMAASLGCKVEILRKVAVGFCEWTEQKTHGNGPVTVRDKLWVAEALVRPNLRNDSENLPLAKLRDPSPVLELKGVSEPNRHTEQLHVAIVGPSGAGKSSLLGILSTSSFDNGRGKSRISLLRHRHEIASGITSSVAQELIGYTAIGDSQTSGTPDVVNYASGNVSSWNDIHATASGGRLVFLSDLPGCPRYVKSTLRGLMSWEPHYVILCIPANGIGNTDQQTSVEADLPLAFLHLCLKLDLPIVLVVTKIDIPGQSIKQALSPLLSALKAAGRRPNLLFRSGEMPKAEPDMQMIHESDRLITVGAIASISHAEDVVPIVLTSAVTGSGIGRLHALLRSLPFPTRQSRNQFDRENNHCARIFDINEVFEMPLFKVYSLSNENKCQNDRGIVLCGRIRRGTISVGDRLVVGPVQLDPKPDSTCNDTLFQRPKTTCSKSFPDNLTSLRLQRLQIHASQTHPGAHWQEVRVVSVRNLRQPVKTLHDEQIGTIGIDPVNPSFCLGRIRKGMVLASFGSPSQLEVPYPLSQPYFHTGFVATFPILDIPDSSSIVVGGNMVVYIRSIRASAKVVAINRPETRTKQSSTAESEIFVLDGPDDDSSFVAQQPESELQITFSFIAAVEWIEVNSRVLAMPSPVVSGTAVSSQSLRGLVGWVCEALHP